MRIALLVVTLLLTGCASADYAKYADAQIAVATAKANAEAEKYKAMASIAASGGEVTKVAAMVALLTGNHTIEQQVLSAPKSGWTELKEWAGILIPAAASAYGYHTSMLSSITASNNSRDVSISTNKAYVGMASQIQAPAANVSTVTPTYTTTTTTSSNNPIANSNNPTTTNTSSDSHANQNNPVITTTP